MRPSIVACVLLALAASPTFAAPVITPMSGGNDNLERSHETRPAQGKRNGDPYSDALLELLTQRSGTEEAILDRGIQEDFAASILQAINGRSNNILGRDDANHAMTPGELFATAMLLASQNNPTFTTRHRTKPYDGTMAEHFYIKHFGSACAFHSARTFQSHRDMTKGARGGIVANGHGCVYSFTMVESA
ncbi:hypothetical protein BGW80DRAFT_1254472 [Lactifluus volemus]|nr:hypothetical protein BGW80DRAFT_1254472 [Lactifluus volemus]